MRDQRECRMLLDPALARLIAILRETPGRLVPYQRLVKRMWPEATDYPPAHARHHLRELIYRARSACESETGEVGVIVTVPGHGYAWMWHDDLVVDEAASRYRRLARSDVARIRTLHLAGQSVTQIAREIGTSKAVVHYWIKRRGQRGDSTCCSHACATMALAGEHESGAADRQ